MDGGFGAAFLSGATFLSGVALNAPGATSMKLLNSPGTAGAVGAGIAA
jgi:hypothetical protein